MEPQESKFHAKSPKDGQGTPEKNAVRQESEILADFSPDQQRSIEYKKQVLSSLAHFIGKDFLLPVELNEPGQGWHWDFVANKVRIDPKDLLEKPMEYLRFVISHEGGHRRVSRAEVIPKEEWQQPGFSFLMNSIEDPRTNNFVAESYPRFRKHMRLAYEQDLDIEIHAKEKAENRLGYQPRFMQAGFEYIKQWFAKEQGKDTEISKDLPSDIRDVITKTLESAEDAWLRYPSRKEADISEDIIKKYAQVSYEIIRDEVWPAYKKLIEQDQQDQQTQEFFKDLEGQTGAGQSLPEDLADKLTDAEQQQLEEAFNKAAAGEGKEAEADARQDSQQSAPIKTDVFSPELKEKLKEYIEALPKEKQEELRDRAATALKTFERSLDEELAGKLSDNPDRAHAPATEQEGASKSAPPTMQETAVPTGILSPDEKAAVDKYRTLLKEEFNKDETTYSQYRSEVLPVINQLENDLRQIFAARRDSHWLSGFRTGKRLNMKRRIQEKAKGIPVMETRSFERRELPREKDYAVSLLVDLSGSMRGQKIEETFKGAIVLAEVLNKLSINTEVIGFNDRIHEFQVFGQQMSPAIRNKMSDMLQEVDTERASWNDDGWAVAQASDRLANQKEKEKFLIVLSDGVPEPSPEHAGREYELARKVSEITKQSGQKLIGLGIGPGTAHVESYYPNSISNVNVREMANKLADVIREAIANYDQF